jgi:hypothetical protein
VVPNKPMVPTAHTSPAANPPRRLRRHIGRPLDHAQGSEWRASEQRLGKGLRDNEDGGAKTGQTAGKPKGNVCTPDD